MVHVSSILVMPIRLSIALAAFLMGCAASDQPRDISERRAEWAAEIATYPPQTFTKDGLRAHYADTTTLDYSVSHGTQIAHLAADGTVYLWYPGNRAILRGEWKTEAPANGSAFAQICFRYGANTFNPVTQRSGGTYDCVNADLYIIYEDEYAKGDPYALSTGRLPFVLDKDRRYTFADIDRQNAR